VVKDVIGREWQLGTVQVDYNLPERFDLTYKGSDGELHRPVMIHRAPFGSMERFCGVLIEHFAGRFPTWLTPTQCHIITIREEHKAYAAEVALLLKERGVRVEVDDSDNNIMKKIRNHRKLQPAYMVILGDGEVASNTVSLRARNGDQIADLSLTEFVDQLLEEITTKVSQPSLVPPAES
jgi:threonyl-tRNA synthetase